MYRRAESARPWQDSELRRQPVRIVDGRMEGSYTDMYRVACARCDFYTPKDSARVQLIEARTGLQKMTTAIPLTDDEQADDGQAAIGHLLGKLADTPTPAGPTPRQLAAPGTGRPLPVIAVRHGKPD